MKILGVHVGHDSSAALVIDGHIVADAAEERFNRVKHFSGLPTKAVQYCLDAAGLTMRDLDAVAVPSSGSLMGLNHLFALRGSREEQRSLSGKVLDFVKDHRGTRQSKVAPPVYFKAFPLPDSVELVHVDHHLAHAASAYYTSGCREKQLIVTMDGAGDNWSTCLWRGENGKIEPLQKLDTRASLGFFYGNATEALGWTHGDGEGKTMGLAPYGSRQKTQGVLAPFHPKFSNGELVEPHDYGQHYCWNEMGAAEWHFDEAWPISELVAKYGREDVAAEAQAVLEEQAAELIYPWLRKEGTRRLACSGGIFLNVKLNQRVWESGLVDKQHIYPNPGDSGLAAGAALYTYFRDNPAAPVHGIDNLYLGPEYSDAEIEKVLQARRISYRRLDDVSTFAAGELAQNKIVAWFQGRMESGPRALGSRSILMSANVAANKDILNARVKFREAFRPFCPSLLWEKKEEYLEHVRDEPFMITSFTCPPARRTRVPAAVHADHTLRPQTVRREDNPRYWELIKAFGDLTGEYLVINTSFNIMGEPIINHPREAIRCFYDNGLDHLIMGSYVLSK